jgi:vacuolar-type H+-ATPase subunit I/STV1
MKRRGSEEGRSRESSSSSIVSDLLEQMDNFTIIEKDELDSLVDSLEKFNIVEKSKMDQLLEGYNAKWTSNRFKMNQLIKKAEERYQEYLENINLTDLLFIKEAIEEFLGRPDPSNLRHAFQLMKRVDSLIVNVLKNLIN